MITWLMAHYRWARTRRLAEKMLREQRLAGNRDCSLAKQCTVDAWVLFNPDEAL